MRYKEIPPQPLTPAQREVVKKLLGRTPLPKGADPIRYGPTDTFGWWGREHSYFDHPYNTTLYNDRAVEVPIARSFVAAQDGAGVEVGNVLSHYCRVDHRVVDRYEQADGVENVDVFDLTGTFDWILAVSTVEHVRWDEEPRDPSGAVRAVEHLRTLLAPGGSMLVTAPMGQNPYLDGAILSGGLHPSRHGTLVWTADGWEPHEGTAMWRPVRPRRWAGAVWVGLWCR
jgi:SAM-dependent methyltransferase